MGRDEEIKKPFYKRWWFITLIVLILIGMLSNCGDDETTEDDTDNQVEDNTDEEVVEEINNEVVEEEEEEDVDEEVEIEEEEPTEEPVEEEIDTNDEVSFGSGMFMVNDEIEPGLYRSSGGITYWERLAGFSGELDDILANDLPSGQAYVEILSSDEAFSSQGSGEWVKIEDDYEGELLTEFSDGQYLVGKDIEPGRYRNDQVTSGMGYWARLSGFTGDLDDIISNDNIEGSTIVEISPSDVGFETSGAGTWTKID